MAKPNRTLKIDMTNVESSVLVPEGDHKVKVTEVTVETSENSGKTYLKWKLAVIDGGGTLYHNTSLQPQALFSLKNVLVSLGVPVPASVVKLNLDDLEGKTMGVTVEHEVYQGKKKARITDVFPLEEAPSGDDEDDEATDDAEDEEVDLDAMDLEELTAFAKDHDIDLKPLGKKGRGDADRVREYLKEMLDEENDEENEDDDL